MSKKRFDFSDIEGQLCFYSRFNQCDKEAEVVIIMMDTSVPYFVCISHGIKSLKAKIKMKEK